MGERVPSLEGRARSVDFGCDFGCELERVSRTKRALDLILASVATVALAPVLLAIALLVWATLGRPVLFRQERVGRGGRIFEIVKFRTLAAEGPGVVGHDVQRWEALIECDTSERSPSRFARFLRSSSLDELPQLVNVLRGEMSLVGPRPERPELVTLFAREYPGYVSRHRVDVGITGLAQVRGVGRGEARFTPELVAERARLDNEYIDNWSLGLDLWILARTAVAVVRFRQPCLEGGLERHTPPSTLDHAQKPAAELDASEVNGVAPTRAGRLELESPVLP